MGEGWLAILNRVIRMDSLKGSGSEPRRRAFPAAEVAHTKALSKSEPGVFEEQLRGPMAGVRR